MHSSTDKLLHFTKVKANRLAKETMNGPGKFGVFIFFCILIVGIHDCFNSKPEKLPVDCCNCQKMKTIEKIDMKTQNIKEIFPQTFVSNQDEKKNKKIAYMNIIKKNQSIKENENESNEMENIHNILNFARNNDMDKEEMLETVEFYDL